MKVISSNLVDYNGLIRCINEAYLKRKEQKPPFGEQYILDEWIPDRADIYLSETYNPCLYGASINTDGIGVFSVSLENEYAYIVLALEKAKDEQGRYMYNKNMIYQWIDYIREMGVEQTFLSGEEMLAARKAQGQEKTSR